MIKAAILSHNGEHPDLPRLVKLLHEHPDVEIMAYSDQKNIGEDLDEIFPALTGETELKVQPEIKLDGLDVVFIAGDQDLANDFMQKNQLPEKLCVIDMTGKYSHPDSNNRFVQGIPELNRKIIVNGTKYVALPHAVTIAVALGLLPLAKKGLLKGNIHTQLVVNNPDAEPESMTASLLSAEVVDEIKYALTTLQNDFTSKITGVEFSGNVPRGLLAVTSVNAESLSLASVKEMFEEYYDDHSFTFVVDNEPDVFDVRRTNKCFIHLVKKDDQLVVTTAIDTDLKGGAGSAVHAMNLLFGLLEKVGL